MILFVNDNQILHKNALQLIKRTFLIEPLFNLKEIFNYLLGNKVLIIRKIVKKNF